MQRSQLYSTMLGSSMLKLVLLAISDNAPLNLTELDDVQIADALAQLEAAALIEASEEHRCGWKLRGGRTKGGTEDDYRAAEWIFGRVKVIVPTAKEPNWREWANDIRLMREADHRTLHDICTLFDFTNKHHFWGANVLSPRKLRQQWNRLSVEREKGERGHVNGKHATAAERILGSKDGRVIDGEAAGGREPHLHQVRSVVRKQP